MAPVMHMTNGRSLVAEEPGIVFSVKELISRLDGKLDMMMNVLTNKADRADVTALEHRVGSIEAKVETIATQRETESKVNENNTQRSRFNITITASIVMLLLTAVGLLITVLVNMK